MRRQVQPHKARDRTRRFTRNRLSRGRGLRETTGCLTCRRRHVKCDEAKPTCKACSRINKTCAWPDDAPLPSRPDDAVATGTPECSTSSDGPRPAASPGHDAASPGGYAPTVTPSPPRNATEEWSDGSGVVGARVSEAPAPSRTEARRRPATRSHPWPPSAHEQGSDTAREYILSPSSLQSAPQTLGASPHLDWLGPAVPGDWMPSALDAGGASQSFFNVDDATAAWASLLIHDASSRIEAGPGLGALGPLPPRDCEQQQEDALVAQRPSVQEAATSTLDSGFAYEQDKPWQSSVPLKLEKHEYLLFQDFVQNLSLWMDFFDPTRPFGTIVPHLAMRNVGLMNAILALSIRHLSLNVRFQPKDSVPQDPLDALPFYFLTLRYIRSAMQHDSYRSSLELLATASIVSAYEMLDGSRPDWERHLRGLSCIQHAQRIHGASGGLRQAVWWTWLCQDVWAAWRERRKPLTTWRPHTPPPELDSFALAARAVYLFGQAVGFCAQDEVARGRRDPEARLATAQSLRLALDRWRKSLPQDFDPLPLDSADEDSVFEPIWIHPPNFGVAVQLYHCSCVLLLTNAPCLGGMAEYQKQQKQLEQHIRAICGIAMHLKGDPESVMCSQALFIAGLFIHEKRQRQAVVDMLESCWRRAGWPHESLGVELQREWNEAA